MNKGNSLNPGMERVEPEEDRSLDSRVFQSSVRRGGGNKGYHGSMII